MHSHEYLLKDVEKKLSDVQKALSECATEKSLLNKNLDVIKQGVEESFKRHIGTLQCRAKWLVCHADSIYHLKEGSLGQQISELELISNELKSCLDASSCSFNKVEEIKLMAKNVLQNASKVTLQPCESGSMAFVATDEQMEESIIGFGDIDVTSTIDHTYDYDLISDEGIVVVENCSKTQDPIEMEVKSIEMHHLTAQSANSEKEDFERIEMEMQTVNSDETTDRQVDSAYEEEVDSSKSLGWLHPCSVVKSIVSEIPDVSTDSPVNPEPEKTLDEPSESTDKVPLWLKSCEGVRRSSRSSSLKIETVPIAEDLSADLIKSTECESQDCDSCMRSQKRSCSDASLSYSEKAESENISHLTRIACSSDAKFLRIDIESTNGSVYSLDAALDAMGLLERQTKKMSAIREGRVSRSTNLDHFIGIFESPNSNFLRANSSGMNASNSGSLFEPNFDDILLRDGEVDAAMDSVNERITDTGPMFNSNLDQIDRILDTPHSVFISRERSSDNGVTTETYITPTNAVNQMRFLEQQPDRLFLRSSGKTNTLDPSLCEWLRGSSTTQCAQCFDFGDCNFGQRIDAKWIKTATDW